MNLNDFVEKRGVQTDKYDLGYFHEFYDRLFSIRKNSLQSLLELGIWSGASIRLWRDYFTNAKVVGVDILERDVSLRTEERIFIEYTDAYNVEFLEKLKYSSFDVIIDDGPHTIDSQAFTIKNYSSLIAPGGVLIIEDIVDLRGIAYLESLVDRNKFYSYTINMVGKQRTQDLLNRWRNGLGVLICERRF